MRNPYLDVVHAYGYPPGEETRTGRGSWSHFATGSPRLEAMKARHQFPGLARLLGSTEERGLVHLFAWAIPNDEAIAAIAALSPLLEVFAGGGYWARLLRDAGADIVVTDLLEVNHHFSGILWTDVEALDAREAAKRYGKGRTLLMIWPPMTDVAEEALSEFVAAGGSRLVYVGETHGCTATSHFEHRLKTEWILDDEIYIPTYDSMRDSVRIFRHLNPGRPLGLDPKRLEGT